MLLILILLLTLSWYNNEQIKQQKLEINQLRYQILHLQLEQQELVEKLSEFLSKWNVAVMEVTAYAPLDPRAKEGMCYSGDPRVTTSGTRTQPGLTIAAGPSIPFGTKVFIQGHGWREVHDRGPAITDNHIDICVWTREEAFAIGRGNAVVVWEI